jgi:hypothetical protein
MVPPCRRRDVFGLLYRGACRFLIIQGPSQGLLTSRERKHCPAAARRGGGGENQVDRVAVQILSSSHACVELVLFTDQRDRQPGQAPLQKASAAPANRPDQLSATER